MYKYKEVKSLKKLILTWMVMILLFTTASFALELSPAEIRPGETLEFQGRLDNPVICKSGDIHSKMFLYDPFFGYSEIEYSQTFGKDPPPTRLSGSQWYYNVSGEYKTPEHVNGEYKIVGNVYGWCGSDHCYDYGNGRIVCSDVNWYPEKIYEKEFTVKDPLFKEDTGWDNGKRTFTLEEVVPLDLFVEFRDNVNCKVNGKQVLENHLNGVDKDFIEITQELKKGENTIECSYWDDPNWYACGLGVEDDFRAWSNCKIAGINYVNMRACIAHPSAYLCADPPVNYFNGEIRKHSPIIQWEHNGKWLFSQLPLQEDKWYVTNPQHYDRSKFPPTVRTGKIPWSEGNQKVSYSFNLEETKQIFISSPTLPTCKLDSNVFSIEENDHEYWIWKGPKVESGSHAIECTLPKSEEFLNMFDITIATEDEINPPVISEPIQDEPVQNPFNYQAGEDSEATANLVIGNTPDFSNEQTNNKTFAAASLVGLGSLAAAGYTISSRKSYFAKLKQKKIKYNEKLEAIEKENALIKQRHEKWKARQVEKAKAEQTQKMNYYANKLSNAKTQAQVVSILNLMAKDNSLSVEVKARARQMGNQLKAYVDGKVQYVKTEADDYGYKAHTIARSPKETYELLVEGKDKTKAQRNKERKAGYENWKAGMIANLIDPKKKGDVWKHPSGRASVDGGWYDGRIFGKKGNLTAEEYNILLEEEARIGKLRGGSRWDKKGYHLGIYLSREALKLRDVGDGFSETARLSLVSEGSMGLIRRVFSIPISIFSAKLAATSYGFSVIIKMAGDNLQEGAIRRSEEKSSLEKFETERNKSLIEAGKLALFGAVENFKTSITNDVIGPLSILFYKEVDKIVDRTKVDPLVAKKEDKESE